MWPAEYAELERIEDLLICGICFEYMNTSVVTSCSHNYCSLCIRKYLHYKTQCPSCFSETFEKDLRKNIVLDDIIINFFHVKKKLQKYLCGQLQGEQNKSDGCDVIKSGEKNVNENSPFKSPEQNVVKDCTKSTSTSTPSTPKNAQKIFSSPSTSGQMNIALFFTPKSRKEVSPVTVSTVPCPVCKVPIPETNINKHLDDCLKRQQNEPQDKTVAETKRKPLPKLVFSLMKDTMIRKKLKELGLSSQGDRKCLESRLQRYIILYNAECDKAHPRAVSELIKQCEEEENTEKKANKTSSSTIRLQVNRNTEQNVIEEERKKYLEAHKDSFDSLIAKVKETNKSKKPSARRSILDNIAGHTPVKRQAVGEDSKHADDSDTNDFNPLSDDEIGAPTSDSDISCPLQTYSSTDPLKLHNVQLSSSCEDAYMEHRMEPRTTPRGFSNDEVEKEKRLTGNLIKFESDVDGRSTYLTTETEISNFEATSLCDSPKTKASLQKRILVTQINELARLEAACLAEEIFEDEEEIINEVEDEKARTPQDFLCDISSNDSIVYKSPHEKRKCTLDAFFSKDVNNFASPEKENIRSPTVGRRLTRKRSRESTQASIISKSPQTTMRQSPINTNDTDDSNDVTSMLHGVENGAVQKMPRKKRKTNLPTMSERNTPVVRKSSRARFKTKKDTLE